MLNNYQYLKERDKYRQQIIENKLKCQFIRIKDFEEILMTEVLLVVEKRI